MGLFIHKFKVIVPGKQQSPGLILILDLNALTIKLLWLSKDISDCRNSCITPPLYKEENLFLSEIILKALPLVHEILHPLMNFSKFCAGSA